VTSITSTGVPIKRFALGGLLADGDWVESKDQDPNGRIRLVQLADVAEGQLRLRSNRWINSATASRLRVNMLEPEDVLIARMPDPLGRCCQVSRDLGKAVTVVDVAILRVSDPSVLPRYAMYAINSSDSRNQILALASGSTRLRITRKRLATIQVPLPSVIEQSQIVRYLDNAELQLGRALQSKRELVRLLDESAAALRWTALTSDSGKQTVVPTTAPWMGALPKDWEPTRLKALLREIDHRSRTGSEPLLSLRMREGLVVSADYSARPQDQQKLIGYKIVNPGELVMNRMRASIGLFGIADQHGLVSPDYATFIERGPVYLPYLLFLLKSPQMGAVIRSESRGLGTGHSGFLRIYTDRFGAIPVVLPGVAEQKARAAEAERRTSALRDAQRAVLQEVDLLLEYRTRLIADVVTGTLDVRAEAETLPDVDPAELAAVMATGMGADDSLDEESEELADAV
jgi:type I restriction enzyme S subunit